MTGPFIKLGLINSSIEMFLAFLIGVGFGYFLERGGLGSAKRLCSVFYLKEFYVPQVMFTAIMVAGTGAIIFAHFGILDMSLVKIPPTYVLAHIVGGVIFGLGFIVGGYCPGTSMVSAANLNLDGIMFVGGAFLGSFIFTETVTLVEPLYEYGNFGVFTIYEWWNTKPGVVTFAVILFALGFMFILNKMHDLVYSQNENN